MNFAVVLCRKQYIIHKLKNLNGGNVCNFWKNDDNLVMENNLSLYFGSNLTVPGDGRRKWAPLKHTPFNVSFESSNILNEECVIDKNLAYEARKIESWATTNLYIIS